LADCFDFAIPAKAGIHQAAGADTFPHVATEVQIDSSLCWGDEVLWLVGKLIESSHRAVAADD